jgi:hypothetical protein
MTDELGQLALAGIPSSEIQPPSLEFANGYFESWLSRLAEPQPDLKYDENLRNQAAFAKISEAVREVLVQRQMLAMSEAPPHWFERLLRVAHAERLTVMTFNYDTLVEAAVDGPIFIPDRPNRSRIWSSDLVDGLPSPPPAVGLFPSKSGVGETFRLLKLHGSVDSWWVTGDATGATIVRSADNWRGDGPAYARQGAVPGRSPFLVPPSAGKSQFYGNPLTRELWQRAAAALQEASTVVLVGYSFPLTDLVTAGMFADRLAGRDVQVQVVNPWPDAPLGSLRRLNIDADASHAGVESYVDELERSATIRATAAVVNFEDDIPLLVGTADYNLRRVTGFYRRGVNLHLVAEPNLGWAVATRALMDGGEPPITVAQLRAELADEARLIVDLTPGSGVPVIDWERFFASTGYANEWAVGILSVASPPPA